MDEHMTPFERVPSEMEKEYPEEVENGRDNIIEFFKGAKVATVDFCQGRFVSKIRKYAESHPDDVRIRYENKDGSIVANIPVSWVRIIPPRESRELTEEQKKEVATRLRKGRSKSEG